MKPQTILSFTSIPQRLPYIDHVFRKHAETAEANGMSVCLALQEDAVPALTVYQRGLVETGRIELLTVPGDYGSNTKWACARSKYPSARLVVVDDDRLYAPDEVAELLAWSDRFPSAFVCRAIRTPRRFGREIVGYQVYDGEADDFAPLVTSRDIERGGVLEPGSDIVEHWAGTVYPPFFGSLMLAIEARALCPHDDDVFTTEMLRRTRVPAILMASPRRVFAYPYRRVFPELRDSALGGTRASSERTWKSICKFRRRWESE